MLSRPKSLREDLSPDTAPVLPISQQCMTSLQHDACHDVIFSQHEDPEIIVSATIAEFSA